MPDGQQNYTKKSYVSKSSLRRGLLKIRDNKICTRVSPEAINEMEKQVNISIEKMLIKIGIIMTHSNKKTMKGEHIMSSVKI